MQRACVILAAALAAAALAGPPAASAEPKLLPGKWKVSVVKGNGTEGRGELVIKSVKKESAAGTLTLGFYPAFHKVKKYAVAVTIVRRTENGKDYVDLRFLCKSKKEKFIFNAELAADGRSIKGWGGELQQIEITRTSK